MVWHQNCKVILLQHLLKINFSYTEKYVFLLFFSSLEEKLDWQEVCSHILLFALNLMLFR